MVIVPNPAEQRRHLPARRLPATGLTEASRQAEAALDYGRVLLERLPRRHRLDNHFTIDPAKWDFYAMDCYRVLGRGDNAKRENKLAGTYAAEILRSGIDSTGFDVSPMRNAEARITLGVIAAEAGDLEQALDYGRQAISSQRLSIPSLLMVSSELATIIGERYSPSPDARSYLDQPRHLRNPAPRPQHSSHQADPSTAAIRS
ncbi:MAG TPA: hypothetical protein VFQ44_17960 [Streptosporangiaceae bacterium]|nr:hypothetical protein [Streptosporangiaceae bacterium]